MPKRKSFLQSVQNLEIGKHLDLILDRDKIDLAESSLLIRKLGGYFGTGIPSSKDDTIIIRTELFLSILYDQADQGSGNEALKKAISNTLSYSSYLAHIIKQEKNLEKNIRDNKFFDNMKELGDALIQLDMMIEMMIEAKSRLKP